MKRFIEQWRTGFSSWRMPTVPLTVILACLIGVAGGYGAVFFTFLIETVTHWTVTPVLLLRQQTAWWNLLLVAVPAIGLLAVSWFTRRFAPEAQGHGVPEVIYAVARHDGVIRPRVSLVKIFASGICIGTGGSIGREGPIVQIGSALGSMAGQWFKLTPPNVKVLVAAGAAAGISATFNAPLAGVIFASEVILGSFAVESLMPIVVAAVLADVVQMTDGEHGFRPAFPDLSHEFHGAWAELPSYFLLGLLCGLAAVTFTKLLYAIEDRTAQWLPKWWSRALVLGAIVGIAGALYPVTPPVLSPAAQRTEQALLAEATNDEGAVADRAEHVGLPPLFGVGYDVVDHALHLERPQTQTSDVEVDRPRRGGKREESEKTVHLEDAAAMLAELWWLLPLVILKPIMTSITLGGGGSGGIFAPSLFIGATLGAVFGISCNLLLPDYLTTNPGVYAIVGMGAVVAGTTHGTLSAILIVYEMTDNYHIILPIMIAAGLAGVVARVIDHESIYFKKLSRREESIARGHDMHRMEHIMVRDVMVRHFPTVNRGDNLTEIVRVARANTHVESLPVVNEAGKLVGVIRPGDLQRMLDTDIPPEAINAEDIASTLPMVLRTNANLLEALRDFGACDIETLPVEEGAGKSRRIAGILLRSDVMRRYRQEMLRSR